MHLAISDWPARAWNWRFRSAAIAVFSKTAQKLLSDSTNRMTIYDNILI